MSLFENFLMYELCFPGAVTGETEVECPYCQELLTVARKHYLGVTNEDFDSALATNPFSKIVQNSVQHQAAGGRNALLPTKQGQQKPLKNKPVRRSAIACNLGQMASVPPLGLERSPSFSGTSNKPVATVANTLQLAAIISAMDRNELEQRLLDLLKEIQPDTSE